MLRLGPGFGRPDAGVYQLTDFDHRTGAAPRRYVERIVTSFAAGSASYDFITCPPNRILQLDHFVLTAGASGAGAEFLTLMEMVLLDPGGQGIGYIHERVHTAAGFGREYTISGRINFTLMPGERIQAVWLKSAAVDAFTILASLMGWLLPRGNVQSG